MPPSDPTQEPAGFYAVDVKEFVVYTLLRLVLLAASFALVAGIWLAFTDEVPLLWAIVLAFVISGVGSYFVLQRPRNRFAAVVERKADKATAAYERVRAREDAD